MFRSASEPDRVSSIRSRKPARQQPPGGAPAARADGPDEARSLAAEVKRLRAALARAEKRAARLEALCEADELTGLLNRRGFLRALERGQAFQRRHGGNAALVFLDLDRFKSVNDVHGHALGDAVLRCVGETLRANLRASDVLARLGGDEFVMVLWRCHREAAEKKAAAMGSAIEAGCRRLHSDLAVSAAAGIVAMSANEPPEAVLARADAAMYAHKHAHKRVRPASDGAPAPSGDDVGQ